MSLVLGGRTISELEYAVMAIVNRTPDSFYDGGNAFDDSAAMDRVESNSQDLWIGVSRDLLIAS